MNPILSLSLKLLFVAMAAGGVVLSKKYFKAKDDNPVEEMVEFKIKETTGIDVDLTPESEENWGCPIDNYDEEERND